MTYSLGKASRAKLEGVHPIIVRAVESAIEITKQDFGVYEGARTIERQRKLVDAGASHTLDSMHIPQRDRTGKTGLTLAHAVDLVPWIDGEFRWEWAPCFEIAAAIDRAATAQDTAHLFCWGAVWDRWLSNYGGSAANMEAAEADYVGRRLALKKRAFPDGPHFQICRLG